MYLHSIRIIIIFFHQLFSILLEHPFQQTKNVRKMIIEGLSPDLAELYDLPHGNIVDRLLC